ncbi:MAG: GTP-binding protein [Candidatus Hodarchaeales archaeon]|jgi:small GTP-binding protein
MKIVVLGPYNSGKSTLVDKICRGSSMSIEAPTGTTIALDHGTTDVFGITIYLFGTPGLERFEVLRKILSQGADGCIMVIDSVNKASFSEAKKIFKTFNEYFPEETPVILAANKQDLEDSANPEEVLAGTGIPPEKIVATLGISAVTGDNVDRMLNMIVLAVISRYFDLLKAVKEGGDKGVDEVADLIPEEVIKKEILNIMQWLGWRGLVQIDWDESSGARFVLPRRIKEITDIIEMVTDMKPRS